MRRPPLRLLALALSILILLAGCALSASQEAANATPSQGRLLYVWFLDVGQADAILISDGEHSVLVDAGNNADGEDVVRALSERGVNRLDYAVGTHPHEDHIGGLDTVLASVPTDAVILPEARGDTNTYQDVLDAMEALGTVRIEAVAGEEYDVGGFTMRILGPVKLYGDVNDNSVVVKILFGETSFLLTGDIEAAAERDILTMGYDVSCDVLKAPHHGSETSSSYVFLRQSNPAMVVICCGEGNSYGHPHEGPVSRYRDLGATVYRTDTMGTIAMVSDGTVISADAQGIESDVPHSGGEENGLAGEGDVVTQEYIGNMNSKTFHLISCKSLPAEQNRITFLSRVEAVGAGYEPCAVCKP